MNAPQALHPTDQTLSSYGMGKLDDASAESVNQHLESCPDCRRRVAELSSDSFLGRLRGAQGRPDSPAPVVSSMAGLSMLDAGPRSLVPPAACTLPPGLADHPDYEVLRELGRGGMGVVYLAENKIMGRKEVLKVVSSHLINRRGVLDRFLAEIRNAAKLHHPHVVTAYAAIRMGESLVLAMEYVEGLDLARMVQAKGPLPVANACAFIGQAALGLQHAHEHSMVHRDIKPSNLMLTRDGKRALIKVLDFGLAKIRSEGSTDRSLTNDGQMLGTPDYIAPEQISNARKADIRADIYSLGCTFYYLLTGGPPFHADSLYELFQAHHSMEATPLNLARPEVPAELAAVVSKMMAKEPERRFQEPKGVAQALKPFFKAGTLGAVGSKPEVSQPGQSVAARAESMPAEPAENLPPATLTTSKKTTGTPHEAPMWDSLIDLRQTESASAKTNPSVDGAGRRSSSWMWPAVAAGILITAFFVAWAVVIRIKTKDGDIVLKNAPDQSEVIVDNGTVKVQPPGGGAPTEITPLPGGQGLKVKQGRTEESGNDMTVREGGNKGTNVRIEPPVARAPEKGDQGRFVSLFNGKDLDGWDIAYDNGGEWRMVGGVLEGKGNGKAAVLVAQRQDFANFHLRIKFREDDHQERGGGNIEIRRSPVGDNRNGYLVRRGLWPTIDREQTPVGSITKMSNHPYWHGIAWEKRAESVPVAADVWNTLDITAIRNRISTSVNGKKVAEYMDASGWYGSGGIAFVVWGDSVLQFQEITIEVLPE